MTVGTGIGAAVAVDGLPWRGRHHSELGHIPVRRVAGDDYPGRCPFHRDCLEGMACGPAIAERWGVDPSEAGGRDDIWQLEAAYLAQLVRVLAYSFAPDRIVFGGGVGARAGLAEMIRAATRTELSGYADYCTGDDAFVTAPRSRRQLRPARCRSPRPIASGRLTPGLQSIRNGRERLAPGRLCLPLLFAALTGRSGHGLARMNRIRSPTRSASRGQR